MMYRWKRALSRWRFEWATRGVLRTVPLASRTGATPDACVVTMLNVEHVQAYLLAIKSFVPRLGRPVEIHILDDGTLRARDHALLQRHCPGAVVVPTAEVDTGPCPRGGCWERLLYILDLSRDSYVIQLDSDVLTLGPVEEVAEAIAANRAFTLGSSADLGMEDRHVSAARMVGTDMSVAQCVAELALGRLPGEFGDRYVRGSAGFAGFAAGGMARASIEAFSLAMEREVGPQMWRAWGTEQVASNFAVANSPQSFVLPWNRYSCFYGEYSISDQTLIHFIGFWRFDKNVYTKLSEKILSTLHM